MRTSRLVIPTTGSAVEVELVVAGAAVVAGPVDNATSINAVRVDDKVYTVDSHNAYEIEAFLQCHDGCSGNFRPFKLWPPLKSSYVC